MGWILLLVQLPSEPSRHRVAVWRELRRGGAVPVGAGTWALPATPAFQAAIDRARTLCARGGGSFAILDAAPRDDESERVLRDAFVSARLEEWAEFERDCGRFEQEIADKTAKGTHTFSELEEQEQSLDRLRRWYRDLRKRDVLLLPEARDAERRLRSGE
ncbi:MAG TPA: Chromate resistance protein ChrB, partial [Amnibacterium sp.]|nr:Chromate resistance protein ChrB [Amnibacterium sp.]